MSKPTSADWLRDHVGYAHDYCLMWPFTRTRGYGTLAWNGRHQYAHRVMCELINGEPPTAQHQAAHSCGRGHEACVNPRHLVWKTKSENQKDCRAHGTHAKNPYGNGGKLTLAVAHQIRMLKGVKLQREVAEQFRVSESTISDIWTGRTHTRLSKIKHWTPEERQAVVAGAEHGKPWRVVANEIGRTQSAVLAYARRLGVAEPARRFSPDELASIKAKAETTGIASLAREHNVSRSTIYRVLDGVTYLRHLETTSSS